MKKFAQTGPVKRDRHYLIPPLERVDLDEVLTLIGDEHYFVLYAPRQTGKRPSCWRREEAFDGGTVTV